LKRDISFREHYISFDFAQDPLKAEHRYRFDLCFARSFRFCLMALKKVRKIQNIFLDGKAANLV